MRRPLARLSLGLIAAVLCGCGGGDGPGLELPMASAQAQSADPVAPPPQAAASSAASTPTVKTPQRMQVLRAGAGQGRVAAVGSGIDCGAACEVVLPAGTQVTLSATADAGSLFDGWGGACRGTASTCTVTLDAARSVTASFVPADLRNQPVDALIAAMPPNSWKALPNTMMKDVCPTPYHSYFCESVVSAWGGAAYDERRDRMIVFGGGHGDSYYNNVFAFELPTMQWQRLTDMPAGATGTEVPAPWRDIRLETCGFYPKGAVTLSDDLLNPSKSYVDPDKCFVEPVLSQLDLQQPRSSHTYGKLVVDRINDRYCYLGGGSYPSAQATSLSVICMDPHTRVWSVVSQRPKTVGGRGQVAVDAAGRWWYVRDDDGPIASYDPVSAQWSTMGFINYEAGGGADIDRLRNQYYVYFTKKDGSQLLRRFDLNLPASLSAQPAYTEVATTGAAPTALGSRPGFVYADARDRFYAWGSGRDVYAFDPQTSRWNVLHGSGDDPGAQQPNGTYGRFRYSAKRNVFVLVNSTMQDVYIFKPAE